MKKVSDGGTETLHFARSFAEWKRDAIRGIIETVKIDPERGQTVLLSHKCPLGVEVRGCKPSLNISKLKLRSSQPRLLTF